MERVKIQFANNDQDVSEHIFKLLYDDQTEQIDYFGTLKQLTEIEVPIYFKLQENYYSDGPNVPLDGLELLLRIRLSYFFLPNISTAPILVSLNSSIEEILNNNPQYSILFSKGVYVVREEVKLDTNLIEDIIPLQLQNILLSIPIRSDHSKNRHTLANEWGPLRLMVGYKMLLGESINFTDMFAASKLSSFSYYWYLLSISSLKNNDGIQNRNVGNVRIWKKFIKENTPRKILIIDDELDKGWKEAFELIFSNKADELVIDYYQPSEKSNVVEKIEKIIVETKWDLVICDLRLEAADRSQGTNEDASRIPELLGTKLIDKIKCIRPTLPVIAFTASNKVWTFKELEHNYGVDSYWIKENPELGVDDDYSLINAANLILNIQNLINYNSAISFMWDTINLLNVEKSNPDFIGNFIPSVNDQNPNKFINERLTAIHSLLLKAYGYIAKEPLPFLIKQFDYDPYEMAFIYVWGTLNEALWLRFKNVTNDDCYYLDRNKTLKQYTIYNKDVAELKVKSESVKVKLFQPFILKTISAKNLKIDPWLKQNPSDTQYMIILLNSEYHEEKLDEFYEILRKKRNKMYFIHGDTVNVNTREEGIEVFQQDLINLIKILRAAIFL